MRSIKTSHLLLTFIFKGTVIMSNWNNQQSAWDQLSKQPGGTSGSPESMEKFNEKMKEEEKKKSSK